jgi:hypothetical protein
MLPAIGSITTQANSRPCTLKVVFEHHGVLHDFGRHARARRVAKRRQAGAGLDEQRVGVAVVAALELDDFAAPGRAARQAQRAHRGFGPRADEPKLIDSRDDAQNFFDEFDLAFGGGAE